VPRDSAVERRLTEEPPAAVAGGEVVVEAGAADAEGNLEPAPGGEIVLSLLSPEALSREADEVHRVIAEAGTGTAPLVLVIEAAEELRDEELAPVLSATGHTSRPVILRVIRGA
jgi:methylase of polypeptide subunit release factors